MVGQDRPEVFVFPLDQAKALQAAIEDLRADLLALVGSHEVPVGEVRAHFAGASRQAFDQVFDLAVADIESLAAHLNGQAMSLADTIQSAMAESEARAAEIRAWLDAQQQAVDRMPPPAAPTGPPSAGAGGGGSRGGGGGGNRPR